MNVSDSTLAMLAHADAASASAAKTGVKALLQLVTDNVGVAFKRGDATELAGMLKKGGINQHSAKRYADITVITVAAIQLQSSIAASKVKPAEKAAAKASSITVSLETLRATSDMRKIRVWAKENGPKAEKVRTTETPTDTKTDTKTDTPTETPAPAAIENAGQIREIRETLVMLNSGQLTPDEALATIGQIVGLVSTRPAAPTKTPRRKTGT